MDYESKGRNPAAVNELPRINSGKSRCAAGARGYPKKSLISLSEARSSDIGSKQEVSGESTAASRVCAVSPVCEINLVVQEKVCPNVNRGRRAERRKGGWIPVECSILVQ